MAERFEIMEKALLTMLELKGVVKRLPGKRISLK